VKRKAFNVARNPLTIVLPLMVLLCVGWGHYISASRDLNEAEHNMLQTGAFDSFDSNVVPVGWRITQKGTFTYTTSQTKGYVGGSSWSFTMRDYKEGSAALESKSVDVHPDTQYLYKSYYQTSTPFDLLVRYHYTDGTSRLQFVQSYPAEGQWSTASVAFNSGKNISAVEFSYQVAGNGTLQLDGAYLEPKATGVYLPPVPAASASLAADSIVPVHPGQYFRYGINYTSAGPSDVVAEYVLTDGSRRFITVATLAAAGDWIYRDTDFEVPAGAQTMVMHVSAHGTGVTQSRQASLLDITKAGAPQFKRPLISITFDDGWKSAYDNGAHIMDQFNYKGTFFLNPSVIDTTNFMTAMQVSDLHNRGNEVAAHGVNHLDMTTINSSQIQFQLEGSQHYVQQKMHVGPVDYAAPYGKMDAEVQWYARQYFRSVRGTASGYNSRQNLDPYNLRVLYIGSKTTASEIQQALDDAKANNGWLIFTYHRVENPTKNTEDSNVIVSPVTFKQQMNLLRQSSMDVKTVQGALDEVLKQ
jgi:peptidoglycan/xylan/chitin deacetylase (PgdA/CDA1 family)